MRSGRRTAAAASSAPTWRRTGAKPGSASLRLPWGTAPRPTLRSGPPAPFCRFHWVYKRSVNALIADPPSGIRRAPGAEQRRQSRGFPARAPRPQAPSPKPQNFEQCHAARRKRHGFPRARQEPHRPEWRVSCCTPFSGPARAANRGGYWGRCVDGQRTRHEPLQQRQGPFGVNQAPGIAQPDLMRAVIDLRPNTQDAGSRTTEPAKADTLLHDSTPRLLTLWKFGQQCYCFDSSRVRLLAIFSFICPKVFTG